MNGYRSSRRTKTLKTSGQGHERRYEEVVQSSSDRSTPGLADVLSDNSHGRLFELRSGSILDGKWELLAPLGVGSFGKVYEARHVQLGHLAAIKILIGQRASPEERQRFLEEAQLMAGLSSEHLVRATDFGELPDGSPYFVMDLVDGPVLRHVIQKRLTLPRALEVGEQVLRGLAEVHARGVIHGDVKPENIIIGSSDDKARLLDFGLAHTSAQRARARGGTPCYMAPEVLIQRRPADVGSDLYSSAVVLYEMITGRLPRGHIGMDIVKLRREWTIRRRVDPLLMHVDLASSSDREALVALDTLIMGALAVDPGLRPQSAMSMADRVAFLRGRLLPTPGGRGTASPKPTSRPRAPLMVAAAVGVGVAVSAGAWSSWNPGVSRPSAMTPRKRPRESSERAPVTKRAARTLALQPTPPPGMVYVPGGTFQRGTQSISDYFDSCRDAYGETCSRRTFEREMEHSMPVHVLPLFMDEYEVTNGQLAAFMVDLHEAGEARIVADLGLKTTGRRPERPLASFTLADDEYFQKRPYRAFIGDAKTLAPAAGMADLPAVLVSWELADRFCRALGKRLPTETEWEYAARGPEGLEYVWGAQTVHCGDVALGQLPPGGGRAASECPNAKARPREVGASRADRTWCGVADMGGNVSEWVAGTLADADLGCQSAKSNDGTTSSLCHVYKGGNWMDSWHFSRPAYRPVASPNERLVSIGFRCALSTKD